MGANVEGQISSEENSYISYNWKKPGSAVAGQYRCVVNGMDRQGHFVTQSATAAIHEQPVSQQMMVSMLDRCEATKTSLQMNASHAKSQLGATEKLLTQATYDLSHCQADFSHARVMLNNSIYSLSQTRANLTSSLGTAQAELHKSNLLLNETTQNFQKTRAFLMSTLAFSRSQLDKSNILLNNTVELVAETRENLTSTRLQVTALVKLVASNYTYHNEHFYVMSGSTQSNRTSFQDLCRDNHGYLVEINDINEFDMLKDFIISLNLGAYNIMLGMTDERQEGQWTYLTSGKPVAFSQWQSGQPEVATDRNCAYLHTSYMEMYAASCVGSIPVRYICEVACGGVLPCK